MFERHTAACLTLTVTLVVATMSLARASRSELLSRPIDDILLEQHNIFRQEEKASNIYKMHWNSTVAAAAKEWASQCQFKHKLTGPYGENLFYSSDPSFEDFDIREILLGGLEVWHDEKRGWIYSSDACGAACHYTQMVWASTTSVGCANHMCHGLKAGSRSVDRALYLVCFYYPRGNWVGEYPFKTGRPCSDCDSGSCEDGLCVEETSSFSSYHTQSENEVKSGSSWNWNYRARGDDSLHEASSIHNVSSVTSRDPTQNGFRHTSSRHTQHNVKIQTPLGHRSHHRSSSVYRVSHSSSNRKAVEMRHREMTYSSGGSLERELESYSPSHSRLRNLAPASLRQSPQQAQYARTAIERVSGSSRSGGSSRRGSINDSRDNRQILQRDASSRRAQSPLDVLRADTHWCRDRLPSCRIWKSQCLKSKAVYLACPRTCGHCGKKKDQRPHALRDRPPPSPQPPSPTPSYNRRLPQQQQQQRLKAPQQVRERPQQSSTSRRLGSGPQRLQQRKPASTGRPRLGRGQRPKAQNARQYFRNLHRRVKERYRGKKGGKRQQKRPGQLKGRRQKQKQGQRRGQRQRNGKRQRPLAGKRKGNGRRRHKNFQTVDKRAEELAQKLRMTALNGGSCADDPKYTRSCPQWVQKGFCNGNVLVSDVYCKHSCGSC